MYSVQHTGHSPYCRWIGEIRTRYLTCAEHTSYCRYTYNGIPADVADQQYEQRKHNHTRMYKEVLWTVVPCAILYGPVPDLVAAGADL